MTSYEIFVNTCSVGGITFVNNSLNDLPPLKNAWKAIDEHYEKRISDMKSQNVIPTQVGTNEWKNERLTNLKEHFEKDHDTRKNELKMLIDLKHFTIAEYVSKDLDFMSNLEEDIQFTTKELNSSRDRVFKITHMLNSL